MGGLFPTVHRVNVEVPTQTGCIVGVAIKATKVKMTRATAVTAATPDLLGMLLRTYMAWPQSHSQLDSLPWPRHPCLVTQPPLG